MSGLSITAVVVIYNRSYTESATLRALLAERDIPVILCDNSTRPCGNEKIAAEYRQVTYLSMGGNVGLPKAYNAALERLDGEGIVCLFDDDTELDGTYFTALRRAAEKTPDADIYLPTVRDKLGLLSPCYLDGVRTSRIADPDRIDLNRVSGINSAMAIRTRVFADYRYDEGYFLDYVDHAFLREMKKRGKKILVFPTGLYQNFSGAERYNTKSGRTRARIFYRDFYRFCSDSFSHRLYGAAVIARRFLLSHLPGKEESV